MIPSATPPTALPSETSGFAPVRRGDAIDNWLGVFTRFLRLPGEQSRAIRDELDSHMRERVRDLMLEGMSEDEGMRRAIDELGEAADLASHFRAAHRPSRRTLMSIAAIGVAASAAVVSIVALFQSHVGARAGEPVQPSQATVQPRPPILDEVPILTYRFVQSEAAPPVAGPTVPSQLAAAKISGSLKNTTLRGAAELIARETGKKLSFQTDGTLDPNICIESIEFVATDLAGAVRQVNSAVGFTGEERLDFRLRDDVLDVAPRRVFDRLEATLVAYDLTEAYRCDARVDDLVQAVLQFVETDGWRENGGDTARLKVVGTKMFVEAPPRYHERVAWILSQFGNSQVNGPVPPRRARVEAVMAPGTQSETARQPGAVAAEAASPAPEGVPVAAEPAETVRAGR